MKLCGSLSTFMSLFKLFGTSSSQNLQLSDNSVQSPSSVYSSAQLLGCSKKVGRPSLEIKYPQIVLIITKFIKQHGYRAWLQSPGMTEDRDWYFVWCHFTWNKHLLKMIPELTSWHQYHHYCPLLTVVIHPSDTSRLSMLVCLGRIIPFVRSIPINVWQTTVFRSWCSSGYMQVTSSSSWYSYGKIDLTLSQVHSWRARLSWQYSVNTWMASTLMVVLSP